MKTLRILPEAEAEILQALNYYQAVGFQLAIRFLDELSKAVKNIHAAPNRYAVYFNDSRRKNLNRFPYAIIFRSSADEILIQAVAHASRRPGYWSKRI
jgi:plasmid stabilization system protein ParE